MTIATFKCDMDRSRLNVIKDSGVETLEVSTDSCSEVKKCIERQDLMKLQVNLDLDIELYKVGSDVAMKELETCMESGNTPSDSSNTFTHSSHNQASRQIVASSLVSSPTSDTTDTNIVGDIVGGVVSIVTLLFVAAAVYYYYSSRNTIPANNTKISTRKTTPAINNNTPKMPAITTPA
tara:strand:- start:894 stop:1430 length:537 start_codon:yes stop_codon:yes gene_type:complete